MVVFSGPLRQNSGTLLVEFFGLVTVGENSSLCLYFDSVVRRIFNLVHICIFLANILIGNNDIVLRKQSDDITQNHLSAESAPLSFT